MNLPHFFRFTLLAVVVCAFGPVACRTAQRADVREEVDGLTVSVLYQKRQAVRNYPVALMEAMRMLAGRAGEEARRRNREIGAVRLTGGSMDYSLVKTRVHVELTGRVLWGTGWNGAVDDPTKLQEEAKMKQQNLKDFMGSLGAVKQPPPMQTVNVYVQPQPAPTPPPAQQPQGAAPLLPQPQVPGPVLPGAGEQRSVVVP